MYEKDTKYKIRTKKGSIYTGTILEENELQIKILTYKGEKIILNKDILVSCVDLGERP